jgi:hypothetical protein
VSNFSAIFTRSSHADRFFQGRNSRRSKLARNVDENIGKVTLEFMGI